MVGDELGEVNAAWQRSQSSLETMNARCGASFDQHPSFLDQTGIPTDHRIAEHGELHTEE